MASFPCVGGVGWGGVGGVGRRGAQRVPGQRCQSFAKTAAPGLNAGGEREEKGRGTELRPAPTHTLTLAAGGEPHEPHERCPAGRAGGQGAAGRLWLCAGIPCR